MINELREERARSQREKGYNPDHNYVGSGIFMYPRFFPFHSYLNWPSCCHDANYAGKDRSTWSNYTMAEDLAKEIILDDVEPWRFKYVFIMLYFYLLLFPIITVIGRFIDRR